MEKGSDHISHIKGILHKLSEEVDYDVFPAQVLEKNVQTGIVALPRRSTAKVRSARAAETVSDPAQNFLPDNCSPRHRACSRARCHWPPAHSPTPSSRDAWSQIVLRWQSVWAQWSSTAQRPDDLDLVAARVEGHPLRPDRDGGDHARGLRDLLGGQDADPYVDLQLASGRGLHGADLEFTWRVKVVRRIIVLGIPPFVDPLYDPDRHFLFFDRLLGVRVVM